MRMTHSSNIYLIWNSSITTEVTLYVTINQVKKWAAIGQHFTHERKRQKAVSTVDGSNGK